MHHLTTTILQSWWLTGIKIWASKTIREPGDTQAALWIRVCPPITEPPQIWVSESTLDALPAGEKGMQASSPQGLAETE